MDEASVEAEIASLKVNSLLLQHRVRLLEKYFDTLQSPWYLRLKWRFIDGFGPWYQLGAPRSLRQRLRDLVRRVSGN